MQGGVRAPCEPLAGTDGVRRGSVMQQQLRAAGAALADRRDKQPIGVRLGKREVVAPE